MITVYGYPHTRTLRVTWMLEELGLDYEYQLVDLMKGQGRSPEFLAINPGGKVPAVKIEDLVLTESAAIVTHLADCHADKDLIPATGTPDRGRYERWMAFAIAELEQPLWTIGKHKFALPAERRVPAVLETAAWEFQVALKLLSQGLAEQSYLLGEHFSAVDIVVGHTLAWAMAFKQPIEQANVRAYADRVLGRPARERAMRKEA